MVLLRDVSYDARNASKSTIFVQANTMILLTVDCKTFFFFFFNESKTTFSLVFGKVTLVLK